MLKKILLIFFAAVILWIGYYFVFPNISALKKENPQKTSFMEYREAEWREKGKKITIKHTWAPLSRISPFLLKAVVIAEDDKFWKHEGFDFDAMQKALEKDLKKKKFKFGGSTISQQLAKNLYLTPSKDPIRKVKEAILTWRLEKILSKRRILELYVNVAEWGEGIFGIEAAARHYFGKSAAALSADEAARLAAVLPNPRKYNPNSSPKYVVRRSHAIYTIMVRRGIVAPEYEEVTETTEKSSGMNQESTQSPELPLSPSVSPINIP